MISNFITILRKGILASALLAAPLTALAVPAYRGPITYTQPDGSVVTIRLEGDERNHRVFSEDGYLLMDNGNGGYNFATLNGDGNLVASDFAARSPEKRDSRTKAFLASLNTTEIVRAYQKISDEIVANNEAMQKTIRKGIGLSPTSFPSFGEPKAIIILVEYQDVKFSKSDEETHDFYTRLLKEEGFSDYGATGSALDWFKENSKGVFRPQFDVYGPVTLPKDRKYYGRNNAYGNDANAHKMVVHACDSLDNEVDFSQYDNDGDGIVDNVFIFYAGYGEADGGGSESVWPHSYDLHYAEPGKTYKYDDVKVDHYACTCELDHQYFRPDGIGTFVHEFSHVMGLPDLYSTSYTGAFTPGDWSPLDGGLYNNEGRTPPNYSAYERFALDWLEPIEIKGIYPPEEEEPVDPEDPEDPGEPINPAPASGNDDEETEKELDASYELINLADSNQAYITWASDTEYFLFENRQKIGNDAFIPGHGMLVWHIDFNQAIWDSNIVNDKQSHQYVDIVEADNTKSENSRNGDSFPGKKKVTSFGEKTKPKFQSWKKKYMGFDINNIAESEEGVITFDVYRDKASSVTTVTGNSTSWTAKGNAVHAYENVTIHDISGRIVAKVASGNSTTLPAGLYIVKSASRTGKILVR